MDNRTLAAALVLASAALPLLAGGNLRVADLKSLSGAGDVAVADFIDSTGRATNVLLTLDFNNNRIVPHSVGPGSLLIDGVPVSTCDGPRQLDVVPGTGGGTIDDVRAAVVCSRSSEVALYGVDSGGVVNFVTKTASGGTDPSDLSVSRDGRFVVVANQASGDVSPFRLDPGTGLLSPIGSVPVGGAPGLVDLSRDGIAVVGNTSTNTFGLFRLDRSTGLLSPIGSVPLVQRPTAVAFGDEIPAASSPQTQSPTGYGQLLYVGVRSSQMGIQDEIRTFRVGAAGDLTFLGSTPAGSFLTDLEVTYDRLFAVTVNSVSQRDEVRAYRRVGTQLILDASLETPESPSFKQIAAAPANGRVTTLFVTGFQAGWLRSIEYTRDDDPLCASGSEVLCENGSRFEISVDWSVPSQGLSGRGVAVPVTADTGYFWFFSSNNVELVVKVVDGRAFNDFFWVFYGALSNVEYAITVTDTATGRVRRYANPLGQLASVADVSAFPGAQGGTAAAPRSLGNLGAELVRAKSGEVAALLSTASVSSSPSAFSVRIDWRVPSQGTSGVGHGVILTSDTAYFWFFSPNNVEVVIKVVDGRAFNNHYWVFYGALSDVEYTITVTNTVTGAQRTYFNPSGTLASVADTAAF